MASCTVVLAVGASPESTKGPGLFDGSTDVVGQIQKGLVTGLRDINAEIGKLINSWETKKPAEPAEPPAPETEE